MALVTTTLGPMEESLLDRVDGALNNDQEHTTWTEYRLKGQPDSSPIHRSVHVRLKQGVTLMPQLGGF